MFTIFVELISRKNLFYKLTLCFSAPWWRSRCNLKALVFLNDLLHAWQVSASKSNRDSSSMNFNDGKPDPDDVEGVGLDDWIMWFTGVCAVTSTSGNVVGGIADRKFGVGVEALVVDVVWSSSLKRSCNKNIHMKLSIKTWSKKLVKLKLSIRNLKINEKLVKLPPLHRHHRNRLRHRHQRHQDLLQIHQCQIHRITNLIFLC